jgi:ACR3 family arsenite transporter
MDIDIEKQAEAEAETHPHNDDNDNDGKKLSQDLPPLKGLSFLDRYLVLWILVAMGIGIGIGNSVESAGPALQRGEFVGVSVPIGMFFFYSLSYPVLFYSTFIHSIYSFIQHS